jgi:hypothetical protein
MPCEAAGTKAAKTHQIVDLARNRRFSSLPRGCAAELIADQSLFEDGPQPLRYLMVYALVGLVPEYQRQA